MTWLYYKMHINKNLFYSLIFAILFSVFPWELILPEVYFNDRNTYRIMVESHFNKIIFGGYYDTITSYFSYEWAWNFTLYVFYEELKFSFDTIFLFLTFFNIFITSLIFTKITKVGYLPFLLNPWFFDFIYSQTRLALAISLLYLCYLLFLRKIRIILPLIILYALLIHTSALLFLIIYIITYYINTLKINYLIKYLLCVSLGLGLAIILGPNLMGILDTLGDRRANEYQDINFSVSLLQMIPWYIIYLYISIKYIISKCNRSYYMYYTLIMLTLVFFSSTFFISYSLRYLVVAYPLIIITFLNTIPSKERFLIYSIYISYLILGWALRIFMIGS